LATVPFDEGKRKMSSLSPISDTPVAGDRRTSPAGGFYAQSFAVYHLAYLVLCLLMLCTGILIHAGSAPGWSFFGDAPPAWVPAGRWVMWHLLGAALLLGTFLPGLAWYVYQSAHRPRPARRALWHWLLWGVLALMCVSGLLLASDWGPTTLYRYWRWAHLIGGVVLLSVVIAGHVWSGWAMRWRLWLRTFNPLRQPRLVPLALLVPGLALGAFLVLGRALSPSPWRVLGVPRAGEVPADLWSFNWDSLTPLRVRLSNGLGFEGGVTTMSLRAFHDGADIYVRADWDDAAEQHHLLPWRRTAGGWARLKAGAENFEDKMAFMFPIEPSQRFDRAGCAYACHIAGGKAYGFKTSAVMLDTWHWKAARTQSVGQTDDQYCTQGDALAPGPVGRKGDPSRGGGYETNAAKGQDHPAFLPDPAAGASPAGAILKSHAVPYAPELAAALRPGSIVPGLVVSPFLGDRGDVRSLAVHSQGQWHVIMRRRMATSSAYDTQFEPGGRYAFAVAAFDHTRWRHAYHHGTYELALQP
jgi:cytochrome b subunit of formate dehydrogenase